MKNLIYYMSQMTACVFVNVTNNNVRNHILICHKGEISSFIAATPIQIVPKRWRSQTYLDLAVEGGRYMSQRIQLRVNLGDGEGPPHGGHRN